MSAAYEIQWNAQLNATHAWTAQLKDTLLKSVTVTFGTVKPTVVNICGASIELPLFPTYSDRDLIRETDRPIPEDQIQIEALEEVVHRLGCPIEDVTTAGHYVPTDSKRTAGYKLGCIYLAPIRRYHSPELYYMTYFHERIHAEGDISSQSYQTSTVTRHREEAIANVGAYVLCLHYGILVPEVRRVISNLLCVTLGQSDPLLAAIEAEVKRRVSSVLEKVATTRVARTRYLTGNVLSLCSTTAS